MDYSLLIEIPFEYRGFFNDDCNIIKIIYDNGKVLYRCEDCEAYYQTWKF